MKKTIGLFNKQFEGNIIYGIDPSGIQQWTRGGHLHRIDGPARIWPNGSEEWFKDGRWHREDGPVCTYFDGSKGWYLYGQKYSFNGFCRKLISLGHPEEDVTVLKLLYEN